MTWAPKASAPARFNFVDAAISAVHNDPVWGWLETFVHTMPGDYWDTATFCANGPQTVPALTVSDFVGLALPGSQAYFESQALLQRKVLAALHDRLFGAMCEQAGTPGVLTWGPVVCGSMAAPASAGGWVFLTTDPAAPWDSLRVVSVTSGGGSAGPVTVGTGTAAAALRSIGSFGPGGTAVPYETGGAAPAGDTSVWITQAGGGPTSATVCVQFGKLGAPVTYLPTPQPDPGVPARDIPPVTSFGDLAPILAAIEFKLEQLLPIAAQTLTNQLDTGLTVPEVPIDATTLPTGDAIGVVITVSGVPAELDVGFGVPQQLADMGRVNFATVDGWAPSVALEHTPLAIRPLPPGTVGVNVTGLPPMVSAGVRMIKPS